MLSTLRFRTVWLHKPFQAMLLTRKLPIATKEKKDHHLVKAADQQQTMAARLLHVRV